MFYSKINFLYFFIYLKKNIYIFFLFRWIFLFNLFLKDYVHFRYINCLYSLKILIMILHM